MFLLGHLGITAGIFYLIHHLTKRKFDYRHVLIGAIISDVIDKSFSFLLVGNPFTYGRFVGHTLVFAAFIFALYFKDKRFAIMGIAVLIHFILDIPQSFIGTLFWPVTNFDTYHFTNMITWVSSVSQYYNLTGEIMGGLILLWIAYTHKLYIKSNLLSFLRIGKPLKKYRSKARPRPKYF